MAYGTEFAKTSQVVQLVEQVPSKLVGWIRIAIGSH